MHHTDINEILRDYESHFADGLADGRSKDEVAAALGDPSRLARELRAEVGFRRWEEKRNPGNFLGVVLALLGLATIVQLSSKVGDWAMGWNMRHPGTALTGAVVRAENDRIGPLLDAGADIDEPEPRLKMRPLAWAVMIGNDEAVQLLLDRGADPNAAMPDGNTPLHTAAFTGRANLAKLLVAKGADSGRTNSMGINALAATFADEAITRLVYRFSMGKTEIDWARIQKGREEARAFLGARLVGDGLKS